ncbi:MAG TPA: hypothetical protein VF173_08825 [Thermoanaerobaculia bacterium]|nr:hypothetical protein [Thermoanaerobaculia bacterium]
MKRVLLDENLPRLLKRELSGHEVRTVAEVGWAGLKNGKLLRLAESEFDIFILFPRACWRGGMPLVSSTGREEVRQVTRVALGARMELWRRSD